MFLPFLYNLVPVGMVESKTIYSQAAPPSFLIIKKHRLASTNRLRFSATCIVSLSKENVNMFWMVFDDLLTFFADHTLKEAVFNILPGAYPISTS
jgi:hypothetical protein